MTVLREIGLLLFYVLAISNECCLGQDNEALKTRMRDSHTKVENYSALIIKGRYTRAGDMVKIVHFQMRGEKMWMETDSYALSEPEALRIARVNATLEEMRTKGLRFTREFDGKKLFEFDPYNLALKIKSVRGIPADFSLSPFHPATWAHMGGNSSQRFYKLIEASKYETKYEALGEGRWKLSQTGMGSLIPDESLRRKVSIQNRSIIIDARCDYLTTEYHADGAQGKLDGNIEWAEQDGNWFPKRGKQLLNGKAFVEWEIEEISFDANLIRTQFNDLEASIPFATRIFTMDEQGKTLSTTYEGGKDGEAEHRLRELALFKRKKEGYVQPK